MLLQHARMNGTTCARAFASRFMDGKALMKVRCFSTHNKVDTARTFSSKSATLMDQHSTALGQLGVKSPVDLKMLTENDLVSKGVPLVDARLLLGSTEEKKAKLSVPQEAMTYLNDNGLTRGERTSSQIFYSSVLGGFFISWGASMYISLSGGTMALLAHAPGVQKVVSALIFPIGLSAIVLSGTDMLTSNMMYGTLPFVSKDERRTTEAKISNLVHLWSVSFAGNLVGCLAIAYGTSHLLMGYPDAVAFAQALAIKKTSGTFLATFSKAVGANWLVNLAIFQATTATTSPGKMAVLWLPITTFVTLGLEHCVANMYLIPLGALLGADISLYDFAITNMVPTIMGNAVGASFFVSFLHWKAIMGDKVAK